MNKKRSTGPYSLFITKILPKFTGRCWINGRILGFGLSALVGLSHGGPLIVLPVGEITRVSYTGHDVLFDMNRNGQPDTGDIFEGIAIATQIQGTATGIDFSNQLADAELTSHYRFSVVGHSADFNHLEFDLLPGQFLNFHVGQGMAKNFDPSLPDAFARASDGDLWLSIKPGPLFENVTDIQPDGRPLNRGWANVSVNNTGYVLDQDLFRTILEKDSLHESRGRIHGDHLAQMIFDDRLTGPSEFFPRFTFAYSGEFHVFAVPEPSTWLLLLIGAGAGLRFRRSRPYPSSSIHRSD